MSELPSAAAQAHSLTAKVRAVVLHGLVVHSVPINVLSSLITVLAAG